MASYKKWFYNIDYRSGGRHSSLVSSVLTILRPQVRIPYKLSMLFSISNWIVMWKGRNLTKNRPGLAHIFRKKTLITGIRFFGGKFRTWASPTHKRTHRRLKICLLFGDIRLLFVFKVWFIPRLCQQHFVVVATRNNLTRLPHPSPSKVCPT